MKPQKGLLTLAAITALFSAGGCDLNANVCVYGPPPDDYTTAPRPYVSAAEADESTETACSSEETTSDTTEESAESCESAETFDPALNIAEPVYGPPISMEATEEVAETSDTFITAEQEEQS